MKNANKINLNMIVKVSFIILALAGTYYFVSSARSKSGQLLPGQNQPAQPVQTQPTTSSNNPFLEVTMKTEAEKVVQDYYNWYTDCRTQCINKGCNSLEVCSIPYSLNKKGVMTAELTAKLDQAQFYDPVVCAQNLSQSLTFDKATLNGDIASVVVHESWTDSITDIKVGLSRINNQWKISSIDCPKP